MIKISDSLTAWSKLTVNSSTPESSTRPTAQRVRVANGGQRCPKMGNQNGEPQKNSNWSSDFKHGWQILKEGLKCEIICF